VIRRFRQPWFPLLLAGLVLLVAACAQQPAPTSPGPGAQPQAPAAGATAQPGAQATTPQGTITVAQGIDADTLDPQRTSTAAAWSVTLNVYDTLFTRDTEGKLQPGLALSYRSVDDRTWEVKLRPNVTFHNGEPMDAEAVKFSLERAINPDTKSVFASTLGTIERVDVVDPLTVNVVTKAPDPILPSRLSMQTGQVLPPKYAQEVSPEELGRRPVGAGPYKFVSWQRDEAITLEAVQGHWREPKIARVVFKPIPEGASRVAAVQTGAVDIAAAIPPTDFAGIKNGARTTGVEVMSNRAYLLNLDTINFAPFQDKRVRQAMNYAINKEAIIANTLDRFGKPLASSVIPEAFGHNPELAPYAYDPDKARQLLAEAGYPNGFEVGFDTTLGRYPQDKEIAEVVAGQRRWVFGPTSGASSGVRSTTVFRPRRGRRSTTSVCPRSCSTPIRRCRPTSPALQEGSGLAGRTTSSTSFWRSRARPSTPRRASRC
jgi:peptide/nickel transport system substrate-binding protein